MNEKKAMYDFLYRKHVHNITDYLLFTLWWAKSGSKNYEYLNDKKRT